MPRSHWRSGFEPRLKDLVPLTLPSFAWAPPSPRWGEEKLWRVVPNSPLAPAVIQVLEAAANQANPDFTERLADGPTPDSGIFDL